MASLFSKEKRTILIRRITQFWDEFKRKKIGLVGVTLIIFFVAMAIFAPWLTPYDPIIQPRLAQSFAQPEWIALFPGNEKLPRTHEIMINWKRDKGLEFIESWGDSVNIKYEAGAYRGYNLRGNPSRNLRCLKEGIQNRRIHDRRRTLHLGSPHLLP